MTTRRMRARRPLALLGMLALTGSLSGCGIFGGPGTKHFSADFDHVIGVYKHSDVRILGVKIGQVTKITPNGTKVHLDMEYDASYKIPDGAKAVITAPSIVSDRYVQLTPVWTGGPTLPDKTNIALADTETPVELDQIYSSLDGLNQAIGPKGANSKGALSDLLAVSADNLRGNGAALKGTLSGLANAVGTLSDNRNDLFGTISNLQKFTTVLAQNDSTVRAFNAHLASVATQLNGERVDLATAVKQLAVALGEVSTFVRANQKDLTSNVTDLASITRVLVTQKRALKEFIDVAPTALSNLQLAYNPSSGTLDTRDNSNSQGGGLPEALCKLLATAGAPQAACKTISSLPLPSPLGTAKRSSTPAPPAVSGSPSLAGGLDPTLGGILEASR